MKIIDLLNKIANGEDVPKFIKYDTKVMEYSTGKQDYLGYYSNGNGNWLFQYLFDKCRNTKHFINDEVEIIEEKKIPEKLEELGKITYDLEFILNKMNMVLNTYGNGLSDEELKMLNELFLKLETGQIEIIEFTRPIEKYFDVDEIYKENKELKERLEYLESKGV